MNKSFRFAIVGCGRIAQRHVAEAVKYGSIRAVCDVIPEKAKSLAAAHNATPYFSIDDLLAAEKDNLDIVCICTPNGFHAAHSIQSLQAGLHVLCEKPMAISSADALKMIDASQAMKKRLLIVKQNRFNPPVRLIKNLVEENKLGQIISFQLNCFWNRPAAYYNDNWHGTKKLDGGVLYTQFSHFIDILYWLLGDVDMVTGFRSNAMHKDCIETEDNGTALLHMKNGAVGSLNYSVNAFNKNMEGSFLLLGKNGSVKIGGQYLNELDYFLVENEPVPQISHSGPANQYGFYEGSMSNHDKVYEQFIKAVNDSSYTLASPYDTMKTVEIIEKIYEASPFLD
jgi:UDP-N-acetyl-2-amino-2-deoxyglucuronate dehydrogenase